MKPKGRHPDKLLTAVKTRSVTRPGRYADGNGLYLVVDPSGAKRWLLRTVVQGRRRDLGLGSLQLVTLAEAREKALALRKVARSGGDPVAEHKLRAATPTFAEAARAAHSDLRPGWKNEKHADQWLNTLSTYALPLIGQKKVDQIQTPDVLRVLAPIWLAKPETARRVRQRIGSVLDWAKAAGFRSGENPVAGVGKGLPKQAQLRKHHAALPFDEVPAFIESLRQSEASELSKLAFEFLILTAGRTGEVLEACWIEIKDGIWTVPADRMKTRREHRVPLSPRCRQILNHAEKMKDGGPFVFPGTSIGQPMSNMVFLMILRRMSVSVTAHGFRSAFRDWAAERTSFPREVCEAALAHAVENKTEAAYRRGDLFAKRRKLMEDWANYATSTPATRANIKRAGSKHGKLSR